MSSEETGRVDQPAKLGEKAVDGAKEERQRSDNDEDVEFFPLPYHYWEADEDDGEGGDDDDDNVDFLNSFRRLSFRQRRKRSGITSDKLQQIAPVYCAAKKMLVSSQLKSHVWNSDSLLMVLIDKACSIGVLEDLCLTDQRFATTVHDDVGALKGYIMRLKEVHADEMFTLDIPAGPGNCEVADAYRQDSGILRMISLSYRNRVDLIARTKKFLVYLLADLKKDDKLLRRHAVEFLLLFDGLVDDANNFLDQLPRFAPKVGNFGPYRSRLEAIIEQLEAFSEKSLGGRMFAAARRYVECTWKATAPLSAQDEEESWDTASQLQEAAEEA
jgi:hypothetical protein